MKKQTWILVLFLVGCGGSAGAPLGGDGEDGGADLARGCADGGCGTVNLAPAAGACSGVAANSCASQHRICTADASGPRCGVCAADSSGCWVGPAASSDGACHAPAACGACGAHASCVVPSSCGDAACACDSGYVSNGAACVAMQAPTACMSANRQYLAVGMAGYCGDCLMGYEQNLGKCVLANCDTAQASSLGSQCAALGRSCLSGPPAACDLCPAGSTLDAQSQACTPNGTCGARGECNEALGMYCTQLKLTDDPACHQRPCADGQAWDRVAQVCKGCSCGGGEWPVTNSQGSCVCTPGNGSFYNHARHQVTACDQDGDGWLNKEVGDELAFALGSTPADFASLFNIRCAVALFTEVELHNEWGQVKALDLSDDLGLPAGTKAVPLYEDPDNDTGANLALAAVPHPSVAPLDAAAVNSLTKVCVDGVDLNRNMVNDVDEQQASAVPSWFAPYQKLTAFAELYRIKLLAPDGALDRQSCLGCPPAAVAVAPRKLVIEERRRCDSDFPMQYSAADDSSYWKQCSRRRDHGFMANDLVGYDFAEFDCGGDHECAYPWSSPWVSSPGTASTPPPPFGARPSLPIPAHGPCQATLPPGDGWRGMTHYSQFLCAKVVSDSADARNLILNGDSRWEEQSCALSGESAAAPAPGQTPQFSCSATSGVAVGHATWLARKYAQYTNGADYAGGCIDEGTEWAQSCPGDPTLAFGMQRQFGQLVCGPNCPAQDAFYTQGYSICAHPVGSAFDDNRLAFTATGWTLSGEVTSIDRQPLSSSACGSGTGCITVK